MCLYQDSWSSATVVDPPGEPPLLTDWLRRLVGGEEVSDNTACGGGVRWCVQGRAGWSELAVSPKWVASVAMDTYCLM